MRDNWVLRVIASTQKPKPQALQLNPQTHEPSNPVYETVQGSVKGFVLILTLPDLKHKSYFNPKP